LLEENLRENTFLITSCSGFHKLNLEICLAYFYPVLAEFLGADVSSHVTYFLLHPRWEMCCRQAVLNDGKFREFPVKVKSRERKDQSKSSPDTPLQRETIDF
jgi:hypothetical protein